MQERSELLSKVAQFAFMIIVFMTTTAPFNVLGEERVDAQKPCSTETWGCPEDWQMNFSVPAIKLRQGEKAKLFEGISVGIQLNNLLSRTEGSLLNSIILTSALMLSTSTTIDATTNSEESDYVFSGAIMIGMRLNNKSFQDMT